jgi:hypothetical protein
VKAFSVVLERVNILSVQSCSKARRFKYRNAIGLTGTRILYKLPSHPILEIEGVGDKPALYIKDQNAANARPTY